MSQIHSRIMVTCKTLLGDTNSMKSRSHSHLRNRAFHFNILHIPRSWWLREYNFVTSSALSDRHQYESATNSFSIGLLFNYKVGSDYAYNGECNSQTLLNIRIA